MGPHAADHRPLGASSPLESECRRVGVLRPEPEQLPVPIATEAVRTNLARLARRLEESLSRSSQEGTMGKEHYRPVKIRTNSIGYRTGWYPLCRHGPQTLAGRAFS